MSPKPSTFKAPLRYFAVAVFGFCVDFTVFSALLTIGGSIYWANTTGFCVGAIINVILIRAFVFPDARFQLCQDILLTIASNGLMLCLGMGVLWILVDNLHINPYWAKLLTNGVTFSLNYVTRTVFFRV